MHVSDITNQCSTPPHLRTTQMGRSYNQNSTIYGTVFLWVANTSADASLNAVKNLWSHT